MKMLLFPRCQMDFDPRLTCGAWLQFPRWCDWVRGGNASGPSQIPLNPVPFEIQETGGLRLVRHRRP